MLWKNFVSTFLLIFLAELGDKTQLTTMLMASHNESTLGVFLGAISALIITTLLGVIIGSSLSHIIPTNYIHMGAGTAFIIIGILLLLGKF